MTSGVSTLSPEKRWDILAEGELKLVKNLKELEALKIKYLGKKGLLTQDLKKLKDYSDIEYRKTQGHSLNKMKQKIHKSLKLREEFFILQAENISVSHLDPTMPVEISEHMGGFHPVYLIQQRIESILKRLGFSVATGPEIENDYYNFQALNIAANHPARAMHDTFYFSESLLLRTHTSPVQVHVIENNKPPIAMIASGKVYRCDSDVTHTPMFHQVEGLVIDKRVNFSELKGLIIHFLKLFFNQELRVRFRASYFPFTEPSAEVDIECVNCAGNGCRVCKKTGWLEVLGCGVVNPNVLKLSNIDANVYQGIAFGMGVERLTMLYYGIDDLRLFFENDMRMIRQFSTEGLMA